MKWTIMMVALTAVYLVDCSVANTRLRGLQATGALATRGATQADSITFMDADDPAIDAAEAGPGTVTAASEEAVAAMDVTEVNDEDGELYEDELGDEIDPEEAALVDEMAVDRTAAGTKGQVQAGAGARAASVVVNPIAWDVDEFGIELPVTEVVSAQVAATEAPALPDRNAIQAETTAATNAAMANAAGLAAGGATTNGGVDPGTGATGVMGVSTTGAAAGVVDPTLVVVSDPAAATGVGGGAMGGVAPTDASASLTLAGAGTAGVVDAAVPAAV